MNIGCIDLFCGVGGLTYGLLQSGVKVLAGYDNEPMCKYPYEENNGAEFYLQDVFSLKGEDLNKIWDSEEGVEYTMLAGCAPCQPFSRYNSGREEKDNKRWPLLNEFLRLVEECEPDFVTMENVPDVKKHQIFHDFIDGLKSLGYSVSCDVVHCIQYGIPQSRKRMVLLASKHGAPELPTPSHDKPVTVRDTIGELNLIKAGESDPVDSMHRSQNLSPINMARIKQSKPGGNWRDWDEELILACHKKESGKSYPSVYGRMEWDSPSPTMTTQFYGYGNGRFGHPEQDRPISLREGAMFQTFPQDYVFSSAGDAPTLVKMGRLIGNAVPPKLGFVIGLQFVAHAKKLNRRV